MIEFLRGSESETFQLKRIVKRKVDLKSKGGEL
jgi:hypothetical protein